MPTYPSDDKIHFLVCEDARPEPGNKHTLLGVFGGNDITINDAPVENGALPSIAFFFKFNDGEGTFSMRANILTPDGKDLLSGKSGDTEKPAIKNPGEALIVVLKVVPFPVQVGSYTVRISLDGHAYERNFGVRFAVPK